MGIRNEISGSKEQADGRCERSWQTAQVCRQVVQMQRVVYEKGRVVQSDLVGAGGIWSAQSPQPPFFGCLHSRKSVYLCMSTVLPF